MLNHKYWRWQWAAVAAAMGLAHGAQASVLVAVPPIQDTYVRSGYERKNYGAEAQLELRTGPIAGTSEAYLLFPLPQQAAFAEKIVLRLHGELADPGASKVLVRSLTNTNWKELELNWRTRPEHKQTLGTLNIVGLSGTWYELDVTAHVQAEVAAGKQAVAFALVPADERTKITFHSRDGAVKKPELTFTRSLIAAQISFCPTNATPPEGYIADHGDSFGLRASGFTFGWNTNNRDFVRDRAEGRYKKDKPVKTQDRRYDFLAYMDNEKMKSPAFWEMAVPNGTYRVHIAAGDSTKYDSIYGITAEGVTAIEGVPDTHKRWFDSTVTVNVVDGRLTIGNTPNSSNNKISFIEVHEVENLLTQTAK